MTTNELPRTESSPIAGFWKRLLAFFIDLLLLGLVGFCVGLILYDYFASIGGWGRLIGFTIALIYFGVTNSQITNGQSFGKKILKIKVISNTGTSLPVFTSLFRSSIICVPYFLNGAPINVELLQSWFGFVLSILIFGVGLSIVYLFAFNRETRQSLHDLVVGSYVVRTGGELTTQPVGPTWRGHFAVVGVLLVLAALAPLLTGPLAEKEPFASLLPLQRTLSKEPGIQYVTVTVGKSFFASTQNGSQSTSSLSVHAVLESSQNVEREEFARSIAQIALNNYPDAGKKDVIAITLTYGYDIGIASAWRSHGYSFSPAQLQLQGTPKT